VAGLWVGSPAVEHPDGWSTLPTRRAVLLVAHNATTMNRLVDIIGVFESDLRIQLAITSKFSDPFIHDLPTLISAMDIPFVEWKQATARSFDLIISASHHGDLHELHGPMVIFSHGLGYTKYAPQEPGARSQEPGARSQEPGARSQERFRPLASLAGQR
jgi:hypothetical protein